MESHELIELLVVRKSHRHYRSIRRQSPTNHATEQVNKSTIRQIDRQPHTNKQANTQLNCNIQNRRATKVTIQTTQTNHVDGRTTDERTDEQTDEHDDQRTTTTDRQTATDDDSQRQSAAVKQSVGSQQSAA